MGSQFSAETQHGAGEVQAAGPAEARATIGAAAQPLTDLFRNIYFTNEDGWRKEHGDTTLHHVLRSSLLGEREAVRQFPRAAEVFPNEQPGRSADAF